MIRVVVVDDHALLRESMVRWLEASPDVHVVAADGRGSQVAALVEQHRPDVLLLDIGLPDVDGITVGMELRRHVQVALVYVTMHDDDATIRDVLRVRAEGFVHKADPPDQVVAAVHAVARGDRYVSRTVADRMAQVRRGAGSDVRTHAAPCAPFVADPHPLLAAIGNPDADLAEILGHLPDMTDSPSQRRQLRSALAHRADRLQALREPFEQLTPREQDVLAGLVRGLSAPAIADESVVSATTVRSQIRAILLKLGVHSQLEAVSLARHARWPDELVVQP